MLSFDAVAGGLVIRPGQAGSGFEIAGADERSVPADVQVRDQPLVGSSPAVPAPAEVCYALNDAAEATLFNSAGLPASSFGANAPAAGGWRPLRERKPEGPAENCGAFSRTDGTG